MTAQQRRALDDALRTDASTPVPPASEAFVGRLEQRLLALDLDAAPIARRRITRFSGAAIAVTTVTFVGAAAAAGIVITSGPEAPARPSASVSAVVDASVPDGVSDRETQRSDEPVPGVSGSPVSTVDEVAASSDVVTSTTSATAEVSTSVLESTTVVVTVPPTAVPPTNPQTNPPTKPPTSVGPAAPGSTAPTATAAPAPPAAEPSTVPPVTEPPATAAPTTLPAEPTTSPPATNAPSTTEVHTPATITLSCAASADAITCQWSAGPPETQRYLVLRSIPGSTSPGRVFTPAPGALSYVDSTVTPGTTYTYLVHAFGDGTTSIAHSSFATVGCCG